VSAALRLPLAPLRQQFALVAPHLAGVDLLVFDQSGLGDVAAELLPERSRRIGVCLIGGERPLARSAQGDRLVVGKSWLIQRLATAMRSGAQTVAEQAPGRDLLRQELALESLKLRMRCGCSPCERQTRWTAIDRRACGSRL
jgi:hypothetical protein